MVLPTRTSHLLSKIGFMIFGNSPKPQLQQGGCQQVQKVALRLDGLLKQSILKAKIHENEARSVHVKA